MGPGVAKVPPPSVAALTDALQVKPVPDVHVSALAEVLQPGIENAVGDADEVVAFARTVFAACAARSAVVTRPVAVKAPVIVGLAIVGELARTAEPVPVDVPVLSSVPLVGRVILVDPVVVNVNGFAPEVVRFPPSVMVLELATPVPPLPGVSGF